MCRVLHRRDRGGSGCTPRRRPDGTGRSAARRDVLVAVGRPRRSPVPVQGLTSPARISARCKCRERREVGSWCSRMGGGGMMGIPTPGSGCVRTSRLRGHENPACTEWCMRGFSSASRNREWRRWSPVEVVRSVIAVRRFACDACLRHRRRGRAGRVRRGRESGRRRWNRLRRHMPSR